MTHYRKRPIMIEAIQFNGFDDKGQVSLSERPDWLVNQFGETVLFFDKPNTLTIKTLEGNMVANVGDYIIKGVYNELYPCKKEIFEATYEKVED